jgi:hypothetical protein
MATSGFAENVKTFATDVKGIGEYAKDKGDVVKKSIGETLSDPSFWSAMAIPAGVVGIVGSLVWAYQNWETVVEIFKQPNTKRDILVTLVTVTLLLLIYVYVLRPEIRIGKNTRIDQLCPDRWVYNQKTKRCEPRYKTQCREFSPDDPTLQSYREQCDFATTCGTNWAGVC